MVGRQSGVNSPVTVAEQPICPFPVRFSLCKTSRIDPSGCAERRALRNYRDTQAPVESSATLPVPRSHLTQHGAETSETRRASSSNLATSADKTSWQERGWQWLRLFVGVWRCRTARPIPCHCNVIPKGRQQALEDPGTFYWGGLREVLDRCMDGIACCGGVRLGSYDLPPGCTLTAAQRLFLTRFEQPLTLFGPDPPSTRLWFSRLQVHNRLLQIGGFSPSLSLIHEGRRANSTIYSYERYRAEGGFVRVF